MSNLSEVVLAHYGVKGMKWGVRRNRSGRSKSSESSDTHPARKTAVARGGQKLKNKWDSLDDDTKDAAKSVAAALLVGVAGRSVKSLRSGHMEPIKRAESFTEHFMSGGTAAKPEPTLAKRRGGSYVTTTLKR